MHCYNGNTGDVEVSPSDWRKLFMDFFLKYQENIMKIY
jgi:hypothetical protein